MVTDGQVRLLMKGIQREKSLAVAAAKAGMSDKTARRASRSRTSCVTFAYRIVVLMSVCPRSSLNVASEPPSATHRSAYVWRMQPTSEHDITQRSTQ